MLAFELLLPIDRAAYIRQVGMAVALSQLQLWIVGGAGGILWWLTVVHQPLRFVVVANILVISALFQIGLFGIVVLAVRYAAAFLAGVALAATFGVVSLLVLTDVAGRTPLAQWEYATWCIAGLFAALGVLLTWVAHCCWLGADIA